MEGMSRTHLPSKGACVLAVLMGIALVGIICAANEAIAQVADRPAFIEDEIGGIRIGIDGTSEVVRRYGPGIKVPGRRGRTAEIPCYWDKERKVGLSFGSTEVVESELPGWYPVCRYALTKIKGPPATGKGIALGDSMEKVLAIYGQPQRRDEDAAAGGKLLWVWYEGQHKRKPSLTVWYSAVLEFLDERLSGLWVVESDQPLSEVFK